MSCIDLFDVAEQLSQVTLVVASDGLWDLWQYKDVLQYPLGQPPPASTAEVFTPLGTLVEETRKQGARLTLALALARTRTLILTLTLTLALT